MSLPFHSYPAATIESPNMQWNRQASYDAPTTSELLELAAENDGTREAEEKEDEKRQKEENWAVYTEANPRGAGNTMNRG